MTMEIRSLQSPPRIDGSKVTGYAARFNSVSKVLSERGKTFREVIHPGAFRRALVAPPLGDVVALWSHGQSGRPPLGRTPTTLRLREDAEGLAFELDLPASAADIREAIDRGDVRGMSFGFRDFKDRWSHRDGGSFRELVEVALLEVSLVIHPAYPTTSVEVRDRSAVVVPDQVAAPLSVLRLRQQLTELG